MGARSPIASSIDPAWLGRRAAVARGWPERNRPLRSSPGRHRRFAPHSEASPESHAPATSPATARRRNLIAPGRGASSPRWGRRPPPPPESQKAPKPAGGGWRSDYREFRSTHPRCTSRPGGRAGGGGNVNGARPFGHRPKSASRSARTRAVEGHEPSRWSASVQDSSSFGRPPQHCQAATPLGPPITSISGKYSTRVDMGSGYGCSGFRARDRR